MYTYRKKKRVRVHTHTHIFLVHLHFSTFSFKQLMSDAGCCRSAVGSIALVLFFHPQSFTKLQI